MNCDEARLEIALWVGNDLDDTARIEELRRHIATCPDCRHRAKSLQSSMVLLGAVDQDRTYDPGDSLWPELENRIDYLEKTPQQPRSITKWVIALLSIVAAGTIGWSLRPTEQPVARPKVEIQPETPKPVQPTPHVSPGYSHSQYLPGESPRHP